MLLAYLEWGNTGEAVAVHSYDFIRGLILKLEAYPGVASSFATWYDEPFGI